MSKILKIKKPPDGILPRRDLNRLRRPLASRVVCYRLRLLGSAHSRFGSFTSPKRYSIVLACSPLPVPGKVQISTSETKKEQTRLVSQVLLRRDLNRLRRPPPSHSRLSSPRYTRLAILLALGGFASSKTIFNRFCLATLAGMPSAVKAQASHKAPPTKKGTLLGAFSLAEKERFELSRRYNRPTPLAGAPLRPLEYFSIGGPPISSPLCYYNLYFTVCQ